MRNRIGPTVLVAGCAALAVLGAGCADHPTNDLNHPHHSTPTPTTPTPSPAPLTPSTPSSPAGGTTPRAVPASQDRSGVLTPQDVSGEGVVPVRAVLPPDACATRTVAAPRRTGQWAWRYPTGSMLLQYLVRSGARTPAPEVAPCGNPLHIPPLPGMDRQAAWCAQGCGLTLVRGQRVSVLEVRADSTAKSAAAIERLAPIAAHRLIIG